MSVADDWIEVSIDGGMLSLAEEYARRLAEYKDNSWNIFGGSLQHKIVGELGRLALRKYLREKRVLFEEQVVFGRMDDFDFKIGDKVFSLKTLHSAGTPRGEWRCEVNVAQLRNHCHYYVFAIVQRGMPIVRLVGGISKSRFDEQGILRPAGSVVDAGVETWRVKEAKKDVFVKSLSPLSALIAAALTMKERQVSIREAAGGAV